MKIIFTLFMLLSALLHAEYKLAPYSDAMQKNKLPIVDIRTVAEWKESGIIKGAIAIEFFNENGQYDIPKFLKTLNAKVDTTKPFALICHTGSRTKMVAIFLSDKLNYNVIDIQGGMDYAAQLHAPIVPYKGE